LSNMSIIKSAFDLSAFLTLFESCGDDTRKCLVNMARTAETAERYEDMCAFMKELVNVVVNDRTTLTVEERNLLSVAYKNVIGTRRASWRTLTSEASAQDGESQKQLVDAYNKRVEQELVLTCMEVLSILEDKLITNENDEEEARVFYLKMAGDYYRYLAESVSDAKKANSDYPMKAGEFYQKAYDVAKISLEPTHPIRLGLALNYSVCHYEILKNKTAACDLAKSAFDEAISKLDKLEEADYKDSTLIMQLLRDNLTLWSSSSNDDENVEVQDLSEESN